MVSVDDLTRGERLMLVRRRNNFNQKQYAEVYGVGTDTYYKWENDLNSTTPQVDIDELTLPEVCVILRRRRGWTQNEVARRMGCSRVTVNNMERGVTPSYELARFWGV